MNMGIDQQVTSPFGGLATKVRELSCTDLVAMYRTKCGVDIRRHLGDLEHIAQYQCNATGLRFWRPSSLAGDEAFYVAVSQNWPNYYKTDRWEYGKALKVVSAARGSVLEVGCGRGYFLRLVEQEGLAGAGLELNREAIRQKVTCFDVHNETIEAFRTRSSEKFAVVCSFQVLEHVTDPASFIRECASLLEPRGRLILSTPNQEFLDHTSDPFDLPPHHMNHFSPSVFTRIASHFEMELCSIDREPWLQPRFHVHSNPSGSALNRALRRVVNRAATLALGVRTLPGPSLVCVLQAKS